MTQVQHPQTLSYPKPQSSQKFNAKTPGVVGWYPSLWKLRKEWEEEMEILNTKYNVDCFSESELGLESDDGEENK